jgi:NTP pyrophosphatase (non-canonical NTP hydrolase)
MINPKLLEIYSDFVSTTYAQGLTTEQSICNCVLSMIGELAEWELTIAHSKEELLEAGDVLYYLTQLLRELEIPLSFLAQDLSFTERVGTQTIMATLSDRTKKHLFWEPNPKYNRHEYINEVKPVLLQVLKYLSIPFDLQTIMEANIDKLSKRKGIHNPLTGGTHD